jgi:DNA-binding transcriptional MerR regulator
VPVGTEYLTIGQVARCSGLSTKALRHYDRVGVLRPVKIDEQTGYRCYDPSQIEQARQICVLRKLKVPLGEISAILEAPRSEAVLRSLAEHRSRLGARLTELQTAFYFLGELIEGKDIDNAMPRRPTSISVEPEQRRKLGVELFNYTWTLLEKEDRAQRDTDRMIDAAHASRFFWEDIGEPVHHVRGEWQISRAYAVAGRAEPALYHAQRCLELCQEHGIDGFDLAYAFEALARAHAVGGDADTAAGYAEQASGAAEHVAQKADRDLVFSDLATLPQVAPR